MTAIKVGDSLNLTGAIRVLDMTSLKNSVQNANWQPWIPFGTAPTEVDVSLTMKWWLGYVNAWASGPNIGQPNELEYWQQINNTPSAVPNINAFNALGTMPFSINATGNVVSVIRKATAAELASMTPSNQNALANCSLVGAVVTTYPAGMVPPFCFSVTMKIPGYQGCWPAVWMVPDDGSWPPEIDVLEGLNDAGAGVKLTTSLHSSTAGWTEKLPSPFPPPWFLDGYITPDNAAGGTVPTPAGQNPVSNFITYTGLVYPDGIFIFYNGVCVQVWPMPTDCNIRWYMLIDSSVKSLGATDFGSMEISDVSVWKMPATYSTIAATPPPPPAKFITEILPGGGTITMTNGHALTLSAAGYAMDNGVAIPNGNGTAALAYNSALDPNGILGEDVNNPGSWYRYMGSGNWTSIATPTNLAVVTAAPPPPTAPGKTFTPAQWTAVQTAFAALKAALGL